MGMFTFPPAMSSTSPNMGESGQFVIFFLNQIVLYPHATEPTFSLLFYVEDNCLLVIFLVKPNDWGSRHESLYENVFLIYVFILLRFIFYNSFNTKLIVVAEGRGLTI